MTHSPERPGSPASVEEAGRGAEPAAPEALPGVREDPPVYLADREDSFDGGAPRDERPGHRWPRVTLFVVALAAGAFFLGRAIGTSSAVGSERTRSGTVDGATGSPAPTAKSSTGSRSPASASRGGAVVSDSRSSRISPLADSLSAALDAYADRRRLFDEGRLSCRALREAFAAVDSRFMDLAIAYRKSGAEEEPSAETPATDSLFHDMADRTDRVDRHFDRSGCPRP